MDLGALDQLDSRGAECIICTEDRRKSAIESCINSINMSDKVKVISYNGISNAASAVAIKAMCELLPKHPIVIIHRDRDFLIDQEINAWGAEYRNRGMHIFSPPMCDVESYYCLPVHISSVYGISEEMAVQILEEVISQNEVELREKFRSKRREANLKFWKDGGGPGTAELWPESEPARLSCAYGKALISKLNDRMKDHPGGRKSLVAIPNAELARLLRNALVEAGIELSAHSLQ